jgi:DNA repair exonuclease SbcCD ATPase subunit
MQAGDYVHDFGKEVVGDDGSSVIVGSVHRVEEGLHATLEEIAEAERRRRIKRTLAGKADAYGWRLPRNKLEQRARLIMRYKGVEPIWIRKKDENGKWQWLKFKMCLDFDSPDMHVRCVDRSDNLHVFNPDEVIIATQDERTRGFALDRQETIVKNIEALREAAGSLREEASTLEEKLSEIEKEATTRRMWRNIESLRKDTISLKRRATALEKRADALEVESENINNLLARAYSEELRRKRRQKLSDFVRKEGKCDATRHAGPGRGGTRREGEEQRR